MAHGQIGGRDDGRNFFEHRTEVEPLSPCVSPSGTPQRTVYEGVAREGKYCDAVWSGGLRRGRRRSRRRGRLGYRHQAFGLFWWGEFHEHRSTRRGGVLGRRCRRTRHENCADCHGDCGVKFRPHSLSLTHTQQDVRDSTAVASAAGPPNKVTLEGSRRSMT